MRFASPATLALLATLSLSSAAGWAEIPDGQQPPPPPPGMDPGGHGPDGRGPGGRGPDGPGGPGGPGGGVIGRLLPPGTWWRTPEVIQGLALSADQQKRMDDLFLQSRIQLVHLRAGLEEEQLRLEPMLNANPPDTGRTLAEIGKIADMRAELEKTDAKMLLGMRAVLTAEQWTKLQAMERQHRPGGGGGLRGPEGHSGRPGQSDRTGAGPAPAPGV